MPSLTLSAHPIVAELSTPGSEPDLLGGSKNLGHLYKLDHLRFLAAFMILFHHGVPAIICAVAGVPCSWTETLRLTANLAGPDVLARALVLEGHSAVTLFITLSGFLFARICGNEPIHYGKFVLNRVLRIYPLYTCAILLAVYVAPANNSILSIFTSLLCFQNLPSAVAGGFITPPLWTVAVEFQFYLLFPFFLRLFTIQGCKPIIAILVLSLVAKALVFATSGSVRELGYLSYDTRFADLLYEIVSGRYERNSTIVTTNKAFKDWHEIFPHAACAVTLVDRLTHKSESVLIKGESYRAKESAARAKEKLQRRKKKEV